MTNKAFELSIDKEPEDIYPMPIFCTLLVNDVQKSVNWYSQALNFRVIFQINEPTTKELVFVHLRRTKYQDILLKKGVSNKEKNAYGISITFQAWNDIDSLTQKAKKTGATILIEPHNTPWNTREVTIQDFDGYRINFTYAEKAIIEELSNSPELLRLPAVKK